MSAIPNFSLIRNFVERTKSINFFRNIDIHKGYEFQLKTLKKLLEKSKETSFGKFYNFERILLSPNYQKYFSERVPVSDYIKMLPWWDRSRKGELDVTWPGKVDYFAVSSGTTDASSKYIPVTKNTLRSIQRASLRQIISIAASDVPKDHITKHWLMIGGSTQLDFHGNYYSGDLSGITTGNIPFMLQGISKPEPIIRNEKNWHEKIELMTLEAKNWDVGLIAGVPAWIQLLFENIIKHYKIKNIHQIWPNLEVYIHGGVSLKPYKNSLDNLFGRPIKYFETYLASEGFIAFQNKENAKGMRLLLRNGIFFEFVPFNNQNFNDNGDLQPDAKVYQLNEIDDKTDYAILISTNSGAWRYLIGDVIRFVNIQNCEIAITGRTKHFLSLCGEHLSVDNMNKGIELISNYFNTNFNEFTVAGIPHPDGLFAHHWYIGYDGNSISEEDIKQKLDEYLKLLNDDYRVERTSALKDIFVTLVPNQMFINWLEKYAKIGAQVKFPRVLKGDKLESWKQLIQNNK